MSLLMGEEGLGMRLEWEGCDVAVITYLTINCVEESKFLESVTL